MITVSLTSDYKSHHPSPRIVITVRNQSQNYSIMTRWKNIIWPIWDCVFSCVWRIKLYCTCFRQFVNNMTSYWPRISCWNKSMITFMRFYNKLMFFAVAATVLSPLSMLSWADPKRLEYFMALTGYLGNAWNVLIFPYIIELCITYALHGMSTRKCVIAKDAVFIIFGLLSYAYGTYTVILKIFWDCDEARNV